MKAMLKYIRHRVEKVKGHCGGQQWMSEKGELSEGKMASGPGRDTIGPIRR